MSFFLKNKITQMDRGDQAYQDPASAYTHTQASPGGVIPWEAPKHICSQKNGQWPEQAYLGHQTLVYAQGRVRAEDAEWDEARWAHLGKPNQAKLPAQDTNLLAFHLTIFAFFFFFFFFQPCKSKSIWLRAPQIVFFLKRHFTETGDFASHRVFGTWNRGASRTQ